MNHFKFTVSNAQSGGVLAILSDGSEGKVGFNGAYLSHLFEIEEGCPKLLVGIKDKTISVLEWQEIYATIAKVLSQMKIRDFTVNLADLIDNLGTEGIYYAVEGIILGSYNFKLKSEDSHFNVQFTGVSESSQSEADQVIQEAATVAGAICAARDLVNFPPNYLRPLDFTERVKGHIADLDIEYEVIDDKALEKMGMNGLFLVGDSSKYPPCLLVLRYKPLGKDQDTIGLVGKGVTFDSGGYSLKPAASMMAMKTDMAGGAAVVATLLALAKNKVQKNVVAVIPLCENRLSDASLVPGDVYTAYSGKTVEVLNTDAEGRLILADAVHYAVKDEAVNRLVDVATLTGAVVAALGHGVTGVVSNNTDWWNELEVVAGSSSERFHLLPDYPEYHQMLDSPIADIKNIGDRVAGSITGGLFIGKFVEDVPWLHLDIAGTSYLDKPLFAFQTKGATGAPVSTLYRLCKQTALD